MASYRLTEAATEDLDRLYEFGILTFGLTQADDYYDGLIERFQFIAENPLTYASIDFIKIGYRRSAYFSHSVYYRLDSQEGDRPNIGAPGFTPRFANLANKRKFCLRSVPRAALRHQPRERLLSTQSGRSHILG